jgi:hypothetical protein
MNVLAAVLVTFIAAGAARPASAKTLETDMARATTLMTIGQLCLGGDKNLIQQGAKILNDWTHRLGERAVAAFNREANRRRAEIKAIGAEQWCAQMRRELGRM